MMPLIGLLAPFSSLRTISGEGRSGYIVAGIFTKNYLSKAEKLAASCKTWGLNYELHEVAAVHSSLSPKGTGDLSFTKPRLIRHMLAKHRKPVLYVDCDCVFVSNPNLIDRLAVSDYDFAIYNWCADGYNDFFYPTAHEGVPEETRRYFKYGGGIDVTTTKQLICSGLVQFYGVSLAAWRFLGAFQKAVAENKGCAEDQLVDFVFNNLGRYASGWPRLKPYWLPKSYARIAYWIYVEPVIDHPDFPNPEVRSPIVHPKFKRFYASRARRKKADAGAFPRDCIIDTQLGRVSREIHGEQTWSPTDAKFWVNRTE